MVIEALDLKQVVKWLLQQGYGVMIGNQFIQTDKLNQELNGVSTIAVTTPVITKPKVVTDTLKSVWNKFIEDTQIPHRVDAGTGTYTIRQYNLAAAKMLYKIVTDTSVDYIKLIASTKDYYRTVKYKTTLSNYLLNDVWKAEYDEYGKKPINQNGWQEN